MVSRKRSHIDESLELIKRVAVLDSASIVTVGGGEANLVDDLIAAGCRNLTWLVGDITGVKLRHNRYDVWHDRAAFHFLTHLEQRAAYVQQVAHALKPGGHFIVATLGPDGSTTCGDIEIVKYDDVLLHNEFGTRFKLVESAIEQHQTPFGTPQQILCCYCKLE
jgi:SAM-dependent methyltransferase